MAASNGIGSGQPPAQSGTEIPRNQGKKRNALNLCADAQNSETITKVSSVVSTEPSHTRSLGLQHRATLNAQQRIERAKIPSTDVLAETGDDEGKSVLGYLKV